MFNPKENLLDQQLAQSGLEMNVDPFTIASAGASIIGGIMGSRSASKQNTANKKFAQKQRELNKESAKIDNAYRKATFEAEKKDYFAARQFQYDMAVKQWEYDTNLQDFRFAQDMKAYRQSVENYGQQRFYNTISHITAKESQQAAYNETLAAGVFQKQDMLVDQLQAEGKAAMGQGGVSTGRAVTMATAAAGRNLAVLRANLMSSQDEFTRGMLSLAQEKYGADIAAKANLMIKPERLPELIKPEMGPERTFVEPAKVLPGAVPPPTIQSTMAPLIAGFGSAAQSVTNYTARFAKPTPGVS